MIISEPETKRLYLRQWQPDDLPAFSAMNADPSVMEFFPDTLNPAQSDQFAERVQSLIAAQGWGLWAVEVKETAEFIGFVGLHSCDEELPFSPAIEIGWRLAKQAWGQGYATEGANKALEFAFEHLHLLEVVSFTAVKNLKSRAVMSRLGMVNTQQNFEHPKVPVGHALREHVLYKIDRASWKLNGNK